MISLALILLAAPDPVVPLLAPGTSAKAAKAVLAKAGLKAATLRATDPQALNAGLIRTHLLAALNSLSETPKLEGALDAHAFSSFEIASREGASYVLAFGPSRSGGPETLRFLLVELAVPIDRSEDRPGAPSLRRLHPLRDALAALASAGLSLGAKDHDRYGNTFRWHGAKGAAVADAWYLPEADQLRVLLAY
jgi:hypothetical protein